MSSITPDFLKKKAREISYALNRVSFYIKREELRNRIERLSFEFLENVAVASEDAGDKAALVRTFKSISALDVLVRIGYSLYEIETVNSNILLKELDSFNSAIREFGGSSAIAGQPATEHLNLESIFSMPPAIRQTNSSAISATSAMSAMNSPATSAMNSPAKPAIATIDKEKEIVAKAYEEERAFASRPAIKKIISENRVAAANGNSTVRQNLMAEKIRKMERMTVKDAINQFPGVSERTLRYDLRKLCDRGAIERIDNGGVGSAYVPKKTV